MKHTPGEWAVNSDQPEKLIVYAKNSGQRIALCSNFNKLIYPKGDFAAANAKLIASAPELLEALKPFEMLAKAVIENNSLDKDQVLYAYNKAQITMPDLRKVLSVINKATL